MRLLGISLLGILAASIALVLGWATAEGWLLWLSILASGAAGISLALAYMRARMLARTPARRQDRPS